MLAVNKVDATGFKRIEPSFDAIDSFEDDEILHSEMTRSQAGFLCGLIKEYRPQKILELGVAAGGTTAIVYRCLQQIGTETKLYSVDLNATLYYSRDKETGYIAKRYIPAEAGKIEHRFFLGGYLPEFLEEIGDGIDFAIIDTVHSLPGELLDFLALLPFLKEDAIVVLHDIALSHNNSIDDRTCYATQVLFSTVTADKLLNNQTEYPNIGGFQINKDTYKRISDMFSILTLPWKYLPAEREINIYTDWYEKYYSDELNGLFVQSMDMNLNTLKKPDIIIRQYLDSLEKSLLMGYEHILFYGAGKRGQCLKKAFSLNGINNVEFIVTNKSANEKEKCLSYDEIPYKTEDTLILLTAFSDEICIKLQKSKWHWLSIPEEIWGV